MIYFTADLHLGHARIIEYAKRPFANLEEMCESLVENWNRVVTQSDVVYSIGDFAMSRPAFDKYSPMLRGKVIYLRGNHDRPRWNCKQRHAIVNHEDMSFYLVHEPHNIPVDWDGWAVHGHVHNKDPLRFPLINAKDKRINVSTEMTGYTPISIDRITELIRLS